MKRAVIKSGDSAAMLVSLQGYDVDTAKLANMAFDARFASMELYARTAITVPANNYNYFYFGETLNAPPLVYAVLLVNTFNVYRGPYLRTPQNSSETQEHFHVQSTGSYIAFGHFGDPQYPQFLGGTCWFTALRQLKV